MHYLVLPLHPSSADYCLFCWCQQPCLVILTLRIPASFPLFASSLSSIAIIVSVRKSKCHCSAKCLKRKADRDVRPGAFLKVVARLRSTQLHLKYVVTHLLMSLQTALKTLMVIHRLMRESNISYVEEVTLPAASHCMSTMLCMLHIGLFTRHNLLCMHSVQSHSCLWHMGRMMQEDYCKPPSMICPELGVML